MSHKDLQETNPKPNQDFVSLTNLVAEKPEAQSGVEFPPCCMIQVVTLQVKFSWKLVLLM